MNGNIIFRISAILLCTLLYYSAYRAYKSGKNTIALSLVILGGFILHLATSYDGFLHPWDERYHALVAKHLALHPLLPTLYEVPLLPFDYTKFTMGHVWVHKQPLPLWMMAFCLKIFGTHIWAVRIPSLLLASVGTKLVYDIACYFYNKEVAILSAFLFSINGLLLDLASGRTATDHVDLSFMFFVLFGVWFIVKDNRNSNYWYKIAIGACIGCAILCKWLPALIVIPIWIFTSFQRKRSIGKLICQIMIILVVALVVSMPWQIYIFHKFPKEAMWEFMYNSMHIWGVLDQQGGNWFYHFNNLRMSFGELIYIPIIWYTIKVIKSSIKKHNNEYEEENVRVGFAVLIWFWVPYLFFSFCATKMQAYTIFAAPAVFMITAKAYYYFRQCYESKVSFKYLYLAIAIGLVVLPVRYSFERLKPFDPIEKTNPQWEQSIITFKHSPLNTPQCVVFNCDNSIELMFETDCTAYNYTPPQQKIDSVKQLGYNVVDWVQFNRK